jgi:hypothetical protein
MLKKNEIFPTGLAIGNKCAASYCRYFINFYFKRTFNTTHNAMYMLCRARTHCYQRT